MKGAPARFLGMALPLLFAACQSSPTPKTTAAPGPETIGATVARLTMEAAQVPPLLRNRWAVEYAAQAPQLLPVSPRRVFCRADGRTCLSESEGQAQAQAQGQAGPAGMDAQWVDEEAYYTGGAGSPLFSARLVDLVAEGQLAKQAGKRALDLYAEAIGPLKLMAATGHFAVGVSASPKQRALYSQPGDQGSVGMAGRDVAGRVTWVYGTFPADAAVRAQVGTGYEFILAKNVLKRGYIRPSSEVPPEQVFSLGMSDADYLRVLKDTLRPGGRFLVYNVCKSPNPAFYDPHADCRSPWTRAEWQAAGFVVRDFERNDTEVARRFAQALGYDKPPVSIPLDDLYATYTLLERP